MVLEAETIECSDERFTEQQSCLLSVKKGGIERGAKETCGDQGRSSKNH